MQNAILVIGLIAAAALMVGYAPQSWQTMKTRNTVGINPWMFLIVWLACMFFIVYGLLFIIEGQIGTLQGDTTRAQAIRAGIVAGVPILISNLFVGCMCSIVFVIKLINMLNARKHKLDEHSYYEKFLAEKYCPLRKK